MQIRVNGKQMDVGEALATHVEDRLNDIIGKYAERPIEAQVTFSKDGHEFVCDAAVHLATGMHTQAKGRATEVYAAFDEALERMEKQLRRYKRRLKNHHNTRTDPMEAVMAPSYVISSGDSDAEEPEALEPIIVAEMETKVMTMSVGEAVMHMELSGSDMVVFRNSQHGGVNVVHAREDGNVGWIDPRNIK